MPPEWVVCTHGIGWLHENGQIENRDRHFFRNTVGEVMERRTEGLIVRLAGDSEQWLVPADHAQSVNVAKTGDKFTKKICNICHRLLPVGEFEPNQRNQHGLVRRPSCKRCRTDIDKRSPKTAQARKMEKNRPKKGDAFRCPICRKRSIVGVTARIVADHDHDTGDIRDFICDSCNTGLGRFKNGKNCMKDALAYLQERETMK